MCHRSMSALWLLLGLVLLLGWPATAWTSATERRDWSGVWDTQWRGGGAVMELQQTGSDVRGTYPGFEGVIDGRVRGKQLTGTWTDAAGEGVFTFVMAPDQETFMGRFGTGEWWTGVRTAGDIGESLAGSLDLSSPEETLRSFLRAGNRSGEGRSDRLGVAMPLLDFSAFDVPLTPYDRIDLARLLFQIVDQLTFRIWELRPPDGARESGEYSVALTQAGSQLPYTLTFRATGEPGSGEERTWRLVVPPLEAMQQSLTPLLEIHGGVLPHARQHHALGSPRDTMRTFLEQWENASHGNRALFLSTMDLSQITAAVREEEGALLGEYLSEVLDRIGLPLRQEIPNNPQRRGPYTHFVHPVGVVEIVPNEQEDGTVRWQFSAETMDSVRQLFIALEDMPVAEVTRESESTRFSRYAITCARCIATCCRKPRPAWKSGSGLRWPSGWP
ncbi:MAG: hypothetical protein R6U30_12380 [Halomonas sp.]|uniref:hypothetical protein n=1 Tax=Halomonas sp. TaxID=1486246 RepID=UPI003970F8D3